MIPDADIERAYCEGLARLTARGELGGPNLDFLLPAAVGAARDGSGFPPPFEALTPEERFAMRILWEVIVGHDFPINRYPRFLGEISIFESEVFSLRNAPLTRSWITGRLDSASRKRLNRGLDYCEPIVRSLQASGLPPVAPIVDTHVADLEWLQANPDPDLWHEIVCGGSLNWDTEAAEAFVEWVITQPDCDRATAAYLYLVCRRDMDRVSNAETTLSGRLVASIVERSERGDGYPRSELTLSQFGEQDDQRALLQRVQAGPERLLGAPLTGRRTQTPYVVHSEGVIQTGLQLPR